MIMTKGDTAPSINFTIKRNGTAINLTGATVTVKGKKPDEPANKFSRVCTLTTAASGLCRFDWAAGDLDFAGVLYLEIQITHSGGTIETVPEKILININDEHEN